MKNPPVPDDLDEPLGIATLAFPRAQRPTHPSELELLYRKSADLRRRTTYRTRHSMKTKQASLVFCYHAQITRLQLEVLGTLLIYFLAYKYTRGRPSYFAQSATSIFLIDIVNNGNEFLKLISLTVNIIPPPNKAKT